MCLTLTISDNTALEVDGVEVWQKSESSNTTWNVTH